MKKNVTLRGIVVTGDSRDDAVANFVAAAKGENVSAHIDPDNAFIVLSNAQGDDTVLLNPLTGTNTLKPAGDSILSQLTFKSESADDELKTFYTVCSDCFSHTIAEDKELAKHCVVCASELQDLSAAEIEALQNPGTTPTVGIMAVANDAKEAIQQFRDLHEGRCEVTAHDCGNGHVIVAAASDKFKYSPINSQPVKLAENVTYTATASAESDAGIKAHIFSCMSDACGITAVASSDIAVFCPVCASGMLDPDEEDYEDEDDEEDDEDYDESLATASDDEDEDDEDDDSDEDDEDDDSEDEDDEDDDSDEDDEEDEDDFESDSANLTIVASATSTVGVEQNTSEANNTALAGGADMSIEQAAATPSGTPEKSPGTQTAVAGEGEQGQQQAAAEGQQSVATGDGAAQAELAAQASAEEAAKQEGGAQQSVAGEGEQVAAATPVTAAPTAPAPVEIIKEVPVAQTVIATNLLDMVALSNDTLDASKLTLTLANNVARDTKWMAWYEDTPIATASARTTEHEEIFGTAGFGNVVVASARNNGVLEALKEFGFVGIAASVAVDTFVKESVEEQVAAQVSEASTRYEDEHKDFVDRFQSAMLSVARAVDINYYKDETHPVKSRLSATFKQLGVQNADALINAAFASSNDEYVKTLVEKASTLMRYEPTVQNQFTELVASGSQTSGALSFGTPVVQEQQPMTSVSKSNDAPNKSNLIQQAVSSLRLSHRR